MNKAMIQGRVEMLRGILLQAGKRLSAATVEKINSLIEGLNALVTGDTDEVEEAAVQQLWLPVSQMLGNPVFSDDTLDDFMQMMETAGLLQESPESLQAPEVFMAEDAAHGDIFLQSISQRLIILQGKTTDGRTIFQGVATHGNVLNRNKPPIVFPTDLWAGEMPGMQEAITQGKALGCLGHPELSLGRSPLMGEYSHKFTKLWQDGDLFRFEAEVLGTEAGLQLQSLFESGVSLDMSTAAAGKLKKGEWQGKPAHIAQKQGFQWRRIADAVLEGASPGSIITDVRLQALDADEPERETAPKMDPEEIKRLIEQARQSGDESMVAQLQALETKMTEALGQVTGLSEEDKTLLQEMKGLLVKQQDADRIKVRDAKIEATVDQMIADKKFGAQFRNAAIRQFQGQCQAADGVEAAQEIVLDILKPLLEAQATYQSQGFYVAEYQSNGQQVAPLNTINEVVEEIVRVGQEAHKLPEDTKVKDPSNMVHVVRTMLQTMGSELPVVARMYADRRAGRLQTPEDGLPILHQSLKHLTQDVPTGAMTTSDIADATVIPYLMPLVMEFVPQLIASRIASIQPMSRSVGTIAYWKIKDEDGNLIKDVDNFDGSYAANPGEKETIKKLKGYLDSETITPIAKKLMYDLSVEVIRRLRTDWGIDATSVMVSECAAEIAREWNYNHLQTMLDGASAIAQNYGTAHPADDSFDGEQWQGQIINYLYTVRDAIGNKTFAPTVAILGERSAISRILWLQKEAGFIQSEGQGVISRGINVQARTSNGEDLISVDWWDTLPGCQNKLLVVGRGSEWYRSGFIVAPYLGLFVTSIWTDPATLDVEQGMMSEVAEKLVNGDYFGTLTIQEGTAGTAL